MRTRKYQGRRREVVNLRFVLGNSYPKPRDFSQGEPGICCPWWMRQHKILAQCYVKYRAVGTAAHLPQENQATNKRKSKPKQILHYADLANLAQGLPLRKEMRQRRGKSMMSSAAGKTARVLLLKYLAEEEEGAYLSFALEQY